jgi:hypothetical protein
MFVVMRKRFSVPRDDGLTGRNPLVAKILTVCLIGALSGSINVSDSDAIVQFLSFHLLLDSQVGLTS